MISEMAMEDIEALRADGIEVTPRDVVRLNALGLKVERAERASSDFAMPRVAFLGRMPLREPTIAAELWFVETEHVFDHDDEGTALMLRAFSMSVPPDSLPDPCDRDAVEASLVEFRKRVAAYTVEQLRVAVMYALVGSDQRAGEDPPERAGDADDDEERIPAVIGVIRDGVVMKLGTMDDLKRYRKSELQSLVVYASELKYGNGRIKSAHASALAGYLCAVDEVRGRSTGTECPRRT